MAKQRFTIGDFIACAREIHGDRFDYRQSVYINSSTKLTIVCPEHGPFQQTPNDHLSKRGCPTCGELRRRELRRVPLEDFITRAREVHGERYDYTGTERLPDGRITITCREHGPFTQKISKHLGGQGCPRCGGTAPLTTDLFVEKARTVHSDRYGYGMVDYRRWDAEVIIVCPEHGPFSQTPNSHLNGSGCYACGRMATGGKLRLSQVEFLERAVTVHGGRYDYSEVVYTTSKDKVAIICPQHGRFEQAASAHLMGQGCRACFVERMAEQNRFPIEVFLERARTKHGNRYDYAAVVYRGIFEPVTIVCRKHGAFDQVPHTHLDGSGCPECGKAAISAKRRKSLEDFIADARNRHGDRYDYSKAVYVTTSTKLIIVCPDHGPFEQDPGHHLMGTGCPVCGIERNSVARTKTIEEFIAEATLVHEGRYDYSTTIYNGAREKLNVLCRTHGSFSQTASEHLTGGGCPRCAEQLWNSKGVMAIERALTAAGLTYEREARFQTCRDQAPLPFDFYLPAQRVLIEFDGEQHFMPVAIWGGEEALRALQRRDAIKNTWAADNGFRLERIRFDEDVRSRMQLLITNLLVMETL